MGGRAGRGKWRTAHEERVNRDTAPIPHPIQDSPARRCWSATAWVAEHLADPGLVVAESNEDVLLYETGHSPVR